MAVLANLVANHTAAAIDLGSAAGFSLMAEGASLGHAAETPVFGRVFDGESVNVAGVSFDSREVSLPILVEPAAGTVVALQAALDELDEVLRDVTRFGGWLEYESDGSAVETRYRVAVAKRSPASLAEYEAFKRVRVVVSLVVDPLGLGAEVTVLSSGSVVFPRVLDVSAPGGTLDALAAIHYTASSGAPSVMLYAWWPAVSAHNYVWNGGAELLGSSSINPYGWSASGVSGVIAAPASVSRTTTAGKFRSGVAGIEVVTPATTDTGASFQIFRRGGFRAGVTYTAQCYVKAVTGTTPVRVKLGISGSLGTGSASALTSSWVVRTATWTPAADSDFAYFAVGVSAATATTFQFDDVMVFEGAVAPVFEAGGFGPGIIPGVEYDRAKASLAGGTAWALTSDTDYLVGFGPQASGALSTNGNLEYPILPHLFTPDDYADDEVQLAVFARVEVASSQTSLACAISLAPDRGTSYGTRRYGSKSSQGTVLKLPSSGTVFKPYFLGTITVRVDKSKPRREWLRLAFTNSGAATGTVGVDYLIVVPTRSCARSLSGDSASLVPAFLATTGSTKVIDEHGAGAIVEADGIAMTPDDGIGGVRPRVSKDGCELLVWPSDQVIDLTDSSAASMAKTFTGSVVVKATPRHHLLKQA